MGIPIHVAWTKTVTDIVRVNDSSEIKLWPAWIEHSHYVLTTTDTISTLTSTNTENAMSTTDTIREVIKKA